MHLFFRKTLHTKIGALTSLFLDGDLVGLFDTVEKEQKFLCSLKKKYNLTPASNQKPYDTLKAQIDEYFKGKRFYFTIPISPKTTPFRLSVYEKIMKIDYAQTLSYKEIGDLMFCKGYRAIGSAVKSNPLPLIIPCHRVVGKKNPNLFSLFDGEKTKLMLLNMERKYKLTSNVQNLSEQRETLWPFDKRYNPTPKN